MKTWQAVSLGVIVGLLLSGLILLLILPQRGEPIQLATSTPDAGAQNTPTPDTIEVYVIGAVTNPGVYVLPAGSRVHEAVTSAGGAAADADLERVNLSAFLADGQRLYLPRVGELVPPEDTSRLPGGPDASSPMVNINSADAQTLVTLPGIGETKAAAILSYRSLHGPFTSLDELLNVPGIGQVILDDIRSLITLGP